MPSTARLCARKRPASHINAVYQLTWKDVTDGRRAPDAIALGAWGAEWHDRVTFESTYVAPPDGTAYEIPLRCLISENTPNLFAAGRTADGDQKAGASLRVMGTAFATGQAAGAAAAGISAKVLIILAVAGCAEINVWPFLRIWTRRDHQAPAATGQKCERVIGDKIR